MGEQPSLIATLIAGSAGIAIGAGGGWRLGRALTGRSGAYWGANAVALVLGLGLSILAGFVRFQPLSVFAIGFMAGSLTGLKYGLGSSEGVWRTHDVWMKSDRRLRGDEPRRDDVIPEPDDPAA